jgi:uncharacterized 2Fe-2S/4Fe-4S cluster protein (DUF4445 family)
MTSIVRLVSIQCLPPSLHDNTGDIDRIRKNVIQKGFSPLRVPLSCFSLLSRQVRACGFQGVAVVNDMEDYYELVDFLPDMPQPFVGMALDLGTTHLEASLVDLVSGEVVAGANRPNDQIEFGTDILTRIHFSATPGGLQILQDKVIQTINHLAADLAEACSIAEADIRALSVSGNTTMIHLLLGVDPATLCREPYIPLVNRLDTLHGSELGLTLHPDSPVWIMPSVGSYFGGDLISGIIASGMADRAETTMLIDVGTNAEVVVGNKDWLIACAGAAGPALEGGIAKMGMRAAPGAVDSVWLADDGQVNFSTIDGEKARGLCGSGIIDLAASLYLARIINMQGKFNVQEGGDYLVEDKDGLRFILVEGDRACDGKPVAFSQLDLDAMMRSKAAMYSILTTITSQVGVEFADLAAIYVAGSFGKHINPKSAITLGMMPDLPMDVFQPVGNSSLDGAVAVLLDGESRRRSLTLPGEITYLELNVNQDFMIRFSGCRFIPHTDPSLFPSVPVFDS